MMQKPFLRPIFANGAPLPPAGVPLILPALDESFKGVQLPGLNVRPNEDDHTELPAEGNACSVAGFFKHFIIGLVERPDDLEKLNDEYAGRFHLVHLAVNRASLMSEDACTISTFIGHSPSGEKPRPVMRC